MKKFSLSVPSVEYPSFKDPRAVFTTCHHVSKTLDQTEVSIRTTRASFAADYYTILIVYLRLLQQLRILRILILLPGFQP